MLLDEYRAIAAVIESVFGTKVHRTNPYYLRVTPGPLPVSALGWSALNDLEDITIGTIVSESVFVGGYYAKDEVEMLAAIDLMKTLIDELPEYMFRAVSRIDNDYNIEVLNHAFSYELEKNT